MATPQRQLIRALATPRGVAPSVRRSSTVFPPVQLMEDKSVGLSLPKIFDIFDAPTRLGESRKQLGRSQAEKIPAFSSSVTRQNGQMCSNSGYREAWECHTTLPPPTVFDGSARPRHLTSLVLEQRRQLRQRISPLPMQKIPTAVFSSESDVLCEVFDGPSRITRYQYHMKPNDVCLFMCQTSTHFN